MRKFIRILVALTIAVVFIAQPAVSVYAHDFPKNLDDWTTHDWERFAEYIEEHNKSSKCYYNNAYNGSYYQQYPNYYYNNTGYNYYNGVINAADANTDQQAIILAQIMHLYGHSCPSQTAQACVGWAVMNSVDMSSRGATIATVAPNFHHSAASPTIDDFGRDLLPLARDIIFRWKTEKSGNVSSGRVLPYGYCYVTSVGDTITVTTGPNGTGTIWNYSLATPYGS